MRSKRCEFTINFKMERFQKIFLKQLGLKSEQPSKPKLFRCRLALCAQKGKTFAVLSVKVVLKLVANRRNHHERAVHNFKQCHIPRTTEWNDQLA